MIFLSYKREDEPRAGRLVRALEAEGLSVWWDRGLPGGEEWRANIEKHLNDAKCVIVLWTHASVGPEGGFVRDEAARAKARNILVPVRAENVAPPLGFGEVQAIDLAHWRGSRSDPFFKDLVAAVGAKLDGKPVPPAKGPAVRLYRRLTAGATATAVIAAVFGFGMNALGVQDQFCAIPSWHVISDTCGAIGLGNRPTRADRLAWENRARGSCEALRAFANNERSHYQSTAASMLEARTEQRAADYTSTSREWRSYVRTAELPFASRSAALADAQERAARDAAEQGCAPRHEFERLDGVEVAPAGEDCRPDPRGGFSCGLNYVAQCRMSERALVERCQ